MPSYKDNAVSKTLGRSPEHPQVFNYLDQIWDKHTIDRFASLFWDHSTVGVDALAQSNESWKKENNYVNPPFFLMQKVINKIIASKAHATVIAPVWRSQPLFQNLQHLCVPAPIKLPNKPTNMIKMGHRPEPLKNTRWTICAWMVYGGADCDKSSGQNQV